MTKTELDTFRAWLAEQTDLTVSTTFTDVPTVQQQAIYERFAPYRQRTTWPKMDTLTDIVGQETAQLMIVTAKAMPDADDTTRGTFVTDIMLALLRYLFIHAADADALEAHIHNHEATMFRPMISQGYAQAIPILRKAKLF